MCPGVVGLRSLKRQGSCGHSSFIRHSSQCTILLWREPTTREETDAYPEAVPRNKVSSFKAPRPISPVIYANNLGRVTLRRHPRRPNLKLFSKFRRKHNQALSYLSDHSSSSTSENSRPSTIKRRVGTFIYSHFRPSTPLSPPSHS